MWSDLTKKMLHKRQHPVCLRKKYYPPNLKRVKPPELAIMAIKCFR